MGSVIVPALEGPILPRMGEVVFNGHDVTQMSVIETLRAFTLENNDLNADGVIRIPSTKWPEPKKRPPLKVPKIIFRDEPNSYYTFKSIRMQDGNGSLGMNQARSASKLEKYAGHYMDDGKSRDARLRKTSSIREQARKEQL